MIQLHSCKMTSTLYLDGGETLLPLISILGVAKSERKIRPTRPEEAETLRKKQTCFSSFEPLEICVCSAGWTTI